MRALQWRLALGTVLVTGLMLGCSSHNYAPVRDLERPSPVYWGSYRVKPGDTLYSIAWRYGRDFRELAQINRIRPPYTIQPGQVISIRPKPKKSTKTAAASSTPPRKAPAQETTTKQTGAGNTKAKPRSVSAGPVKPLSWRWPASGKLMQSFTASGRRGIAIQAAAGNQVLAAADGIVVYAGAGLISYGNLIIIKHNETYLSAYAHNRKMLVAENKIVKVGEKIAEIGSTGAGETKLHFEIRRNGKPVDPLRYLPKR